MKVLFAHGWGCRPELWNPMRKLLVRSSPAADFEIVCLDFGFFGDQQIHSGHFDLAVGHSFGLLWLLHQQQLTFDSLLSINGFTRFFADEDFAFGTPRRFVERMVRKIQRSPATVLNDFFQLCGADDLAQKYPACGWLQPSDNLSFKAERLTWALDGLNNWDERSQLKVLEARNIALYALAATEDRVVSPQLSEACFSYHNVIWHPTDSHLLPLRAPELCVKTIQNMIAAS